MTYTFRGKVSEQYFYDLFQEKTDWSHQFNPAIGFQVDVIRLGRDRRNPNNAYSPLNQYAKILVYRTWKNNNPSNSVYLVVKGPVARTINEVWKVWYETLSLDDAWKKYNEMIENPDAPKETRIVRF